MRSLFLLLTPFLAHAGDPTYELIAPIGTLPEKVTLETYLSGMYTTVIGIAGILAVLMLVICGIKLMGSGGTQGKSEARQCITNAILGLLLAIGSWILLYTINPELVGTSAKLAVGVPSAPPAAEKIVSTTTFVPNARTDGFSCSASDTLGCVTTNFPIERILPYSHTPTPEKVTAFGFSTPGAGAFKGTITATAADLATLGKLLIISEIAGDTATFGKYPACMAQGESTSIIKYSMDPTSDPDTYCILKPDTRYYINVVNLEKGTTNPTCTDVASCTFSLWTNNEKVAVAPTGGGGGGGVCTLRDPGKGLWSPDVNAAVPVYVVDQSTDEGNPTSITSVPGCINGASIDNAGTCRKSTSYSGSISGKTVSITSKPGHILSIRYFVDHTKKLEANSGDFNLRNDVGGNTGPMTISLSATPGDMNPSNPQCVSTSSKAPVIGVGNDYCPIDMARDIYYLNIRFDFDRSGAIGGLILTEPRPDVFVFHPGTVTLPNGQCLKTGGAPVDPGKGLWSPNLKAATPVYVIDKTWGTAGVLPGCIMGVKPDTSWYSDSTCAQNPSYTGKIDGKTVTLNNKPGYILSIRYYVDKAGWASVPPAPPPSARFTLNNAIGGALGSPVTMTFTENPGDMNPKIERCKNTSAMNPSLTIQNIDALDPKKFTMCTIDITKKLYYLNIRVEEDYSKWSLYLDDEGGKKFNQASY